MAKSKSKSKSNPFINEKTMAIIRAELIHMTDGYARVLHDTKAIYEDAVSFLVHVAVQHHEELYNMNQQDSLTYMEQLVHKTKDNPDPKYPLFDVLFNRMPSYIRRAAINAAVGHASSHETRWDQYHAHRDPLVEKGIHYKKMEPAFTYTPKMCPTLYKNQSFVFQGRSIQIKVYMNHHWAWITVAISNKDMKCIQKAVSKGGTLLSPKLVYDYHKFYLEFPVQYPSASWAEVPLEKQTVMGVDRGFNHGAVYSVIDCSGSVLGRGFDPFTSDMARIDHIINRIRKVQAQSGKGQSLAALYTKLRGLKENYVRQLARWIVNEAIKHGVYGIVLEHLESLRRKKHKGGMGARLHHWITAKLRDYVKGMAFRAGIRVFIINPWGTSKYAFDGSGEVIRGKEAGFSSKEWCLFANGKQYNCDLSASYNIGARYFLRAYSKSIAAKLWSGLKAKVPGLSKRTNWVLATLRSLRAELGPEKACAA